MENLTIRLRNIILEWQLKDSKELTRVKPFGEAAHLNTCVKGHVFKT